MHPLLKKAFVFFIQHKNFSAFLTLSAVIFLSGYLYLTGLGLYGDDFGAHTYLFNSNLKDAVLEWWRAGSGEISNFRMLAVILPVSWFFLYKFFGFLGIILFNFFVYSFLAYFLYILLKRSMPEAIAFFGAVLFALFPVNNAYLWHVTLSYSLALLGIFAAAYFFQKQKIWTTFILLSVSILINEGVFFIFAIALLPKAGEEFSFKAFWPLFRKWLVVVAGLVVVYIGARLYFEINGAIGGNRAVSVLEHFSLTVYLTQFFQSAAVVLAIGFAAGVWKIYKTITLAGFLVGLVAAVFARFFFKQFSEYSGLKNRKHSLLIMFLGLVLIVAGRYYGFYYVPSINVLNLDSRYYFAASVGGAVFFAGFLGFLLTEYQARQKLIFNMAALLIGFLAIFRFSVQLDYKAGTLEARQLWQQVLPVLGAMPENSFIYVSLPEKELGRPVSLFEASGDLRNLLPAMHSPARGATSAYVQRLSFVEKKVCLDSAPFYKNFCFNKETFYSFSWDGKALKQTLGQPVNPGVPFNGEANFFKVIKP